MMRFEAIRADIPKKLLSVISSLFAFSHQNKRFLYLLLWLVSFFLSYTVSFCTVKVLLLLCALLLLGSIALCFKIGFRRSLLLLFLIPLLAFSLTLYHRAPTERLSEYYEKEAIAELTITDISAADTDKKTATASLFSLNGDPLSAKVALILPARSPYTIGDTVSCLVEDICAPSKWQLTEGINGVMTLKVGDKTGERHTVFSFAAEQNNKLSSLLRRRVTGEEGALLSAFLLGDREGVSDSVSLALERTGTTHMLALSGMHFSIIIGGVGFLLRGVHKKKRYLLFIALLLFYTLLTGLAPSILRACFMSLFAFSAFLSGRANHSLYSLLVSLSLIFFFEPYTVFSLSLWLSALATAGILLFLARKEQAPVETKEATLWKRLWRYIKEYVFLSSAVTSAATVAVLPLTAYYFGSYSLLSIPANLLLAPLMQLSLYGAILVLFLGFLPPVAFVARGAAFLFLRLASLLSSIPHSQISLARPVSLVAVVLFFSAITLYCTLTPAKHFRPKRVLSMLLCLGLVLSLVHLTDTYVHKNGVRLDYFSVKTEKQEGDLLCLRESTKAFMFAVSLQDTSLTYAVKDALSSCYRQELDGYIITEYQRDTEEHLKDLCEGCFVSALYLPSPDNEAEMEIASRLKSWSEEDGPSLVFYQRGAKVSLGKTDFSLLSASASSCCFSLSFGKERALYASASSLQKDAFALLSRLSSHSLVICGSYGYRENKGLPESLSSLFSGKELWCAKEDILPASLPFSARTHYRKSIFVLPTPFFLEIKKSYV
ncbi:MAG: ComEC/Rec2 family competence protein [Clostridia bacterium]|nr:ComEC/Rec2 family competence protein [Clostridia bacterium]